MGFIQAVKDVASRAGSALHNYGTAVKQNLNQTIQTGQFQNTLAMAIPGGVAAKGAQGAFSKTKSLLGKVGTMAKEEFLGAPKTMGSLFKSAAKGTALAATGLTLGNYAATGRFRPPSGRALAGLFGLRTSPISTAAGALEGAGHAIADAVTGKIGNAGTNVMIPDYTLPQIPNINYTAPDVYINSTTPMPDFSQLQLPSASYQAPSYSPSVQVGGGGMNDALLLALLAGAGAAGYAGYRIGKRSKKRKYKKRRKH